ncbi:MAG: DUF3592 domain-containing protein [Candidatus Acidiferrales bacterium]|jgi:hypothetical protein
MAIACPNCAAKTTSAVNKPYCAHCGWNVGSAEDAVRFNGAACFIVALLFAGLLGHLAIVQRDGQLLAITAVLFVLALLLTYRFAWAAPLNRLRTVRQALSLPPPTRKPWLKVEVHREIHRGEPRPIDAPGATGAKRLDFHVRVDRPRVSFTDTSASTEPGEATAAQKALAEEEFGRLSSLPRPRSVRMTRRGILYGLLAGSALLGMASLFGYAAWRVAAFHKPLPRLDGSDWFSAVVGVGFALALVGTLRRVVRDRRLLANGRIALGRIVTQRTGRSHYFFYEYSSITYSFSDGSLRTFTKVGTDYSKQYYEGMWVPIFYDPEKPGRCVADGCALCRLNVPR